MLSLDNEYVLEYKGLEFGIKPIDIIRYRRNMIIGTLDGRGLQ